MISKWVRENVKDIQNSKLVWKYKLWVQKYHFPNIIMFAKYDQVVGTI